MSASTRTPAEMLAELEETLSVTRVYEGRLDAEDAHYFGLCRQAAHVIHIDPAPAIVGTLVHELLHARYPSWSERRVAREGDRLFRSMAPADVDRWWRRYQRIRQRHRRRKVDGL